MSRLFELVYQATDNDISFKCPFTKDSLMKTLTDNGIDHETNEDSPPNWFPGTFRLGQYCIYAGNFEIHEEDIIN